MDWAANLVSIACIAADGFDRVYTVSVNEIMRFSGFIKIYRASLDGSQVSAVQQASCTCCIMFALLALHCSAVSPNESGHICRPYVHGLPLRVPLCMAWSAALLICAGAAAGQLPGPQPDHHPQ